MTEDEVFDLLDGGWITKRDSQDYSDYQWNVEIGDINGDLADSYGNTPEIAWHKAIVEMLESLSERKRENSEANEPTLTAGERNR